MFTLLRAISHLHNTLDSYKKRTNSEWCERDKEAFQVLLDARRQLAIAYGATEQFAWHDMEKNPDDLPPRYRRVYVQHKNGLCECAELTMDGKWLCDLGEYAIEPSLVVAWRIVSGYDKDKARLM